MQNTVEFINSKTGGIAPEIGLILGSGLGDLANEIDGVSIPYGDIPNFCKSTVQGHAGKLVIGKLCGKSVVAMQGRFHFYEGHSLQTVIFPVRVMKALGIEKLIVTNAAGGVNTFFSPGDLMMITDHLNLLGTSPLFGPNDDSLGPRFVDMSYAYDKSLQTLIEQSAQTLEIKLRKGVYAAMTGPTYETPAEVRMLRTIGADAVGMSTVPEVIAANHMGIKTAGLSCITNMAAGILDQPLNHEEVIETSNRVKDSFTKLLKEFISRI